MSQESGESSVTEKPLGESAGFSLAENSKENDAIYPLDGAAYFQRQPNLRKYFPAETQNIRIWANPLRDAPPPKCSITTSGW